MKKNIFVVLFMFCFCSVCYSQQSGVDLPKGTKSVPAEDKKVKFILPNGNIISLQNVSGSSQLAGDGSVYDPEGKSSFFEVPGGTRFIRCDGVLYDINKGSVVPEEDYVIVDKQAVWLPAKINLRGPGTPLKK